MKKLTFPFAFFIGLLAVGGLSNSKVVGLSTPAFLKLDRAPDAGEEEGPATFPHLMHQRMFMCFECHPSIFSYGRDLYTHDDFDEGKFCAECHNGKVAQHVDDMDCEVCHLE